MNKPEKIHRLRHSATDSAARRGRYSRGGEPIRLSEILIDFLDLRPAQESPRAKQQIKLRRTRMEDPG